MPLPSPGPSSSTGSANPLPATTPQAFATYLNGKFKGTDGKLGDPLTPLDSLGLTGATIGDQWLSFYAEASARDPGKTLEQYEEAFVVLAEEAYLGLDLAAGTSGGLAAGGAFAQSATVTAAQEAGSIFSVLQSGSLWLRVGEVVLGIALIIVAVAKLASGTPAGKAALKVGKAAAIL